MKTEALKLALEAAYLAGFNASGEGYNGEYPFQDNDVRPEKDDGWVGGRDNRINAIKEALAQPIIESYLEKDNLQPEQSCPECVFGVCHCKPLAQPEQRSNEHLEPVAITAQMAFAFHDAITDGALGTDDMMDIMRGLEAAFAHITTTPQRTAAEGEDTQRAWVGLTDEEAVELMRKVPHLTIGGLLSVEAKLKEKNT